MQQTRLTGYALFIMILSGIGGILYGYEIGVINTVLLSIENDIVLSPAQTGFMVAAMFIGGMFATPIAAAFADQFGRKKVMVFSALFFIAGVTMLAIANTFIGLVMGRLLQGMGIGFVSIVIPLFIAEIMPATFRGRAIAVFQLLLTGGILVASLVGYHFTKSADWRAIVWSAAIPGIIFLFCLFFIPESPRWLALRGKIDKARDIFRRVHGDETADKEFATIQQSDENHSFNVGKSLTALFDKKYAGIVGVVFAIAALQQLMGINAFLQYNGLVLEAAGTASDVSAALGGVWITLMNFLITIVALLLVDKFGRKPLMKFGLTGIIITLISAAFVYTVLPYGELRANLILFAFLAYVVFYASGPGVVIWLILSELLPTPVRSLGMGIGLSLNTLASASLAWAFLPLASSIGFNGLFLLTAGCASIYLALIIYKVPEGKNKSLEEIEQQFASENSEA